jgi:uncharacterized protein (DUF302 family)
MMHKRSRLLVASLFFVLVSPWVQADDGLVSLRSQFDVTQTLDRFEAAAKQAGLKIFARIDHAEGAASVGKSLRSTQLLIFGSPQVGTGVMSSDQRAGIDLPLKALAWRDAQGVVWLSYTRPDYMFARFGIDDRPKVQQNMSGALEKFARAATQP